jgi:hypothetical protein
MTGIYPFHLACVCPAFRSQIQKFTDIYNKVTERTTFLPNLKSALFGSCPDLMIKERTAAALEWHGGHRQCDWCRAATIPYRFEQHSFRQSAHFLGLHCRMIASVDTGVSKSFNFVLRASDSVRHSFNFVFDQILSVMADSAAQLPAGPDFLTPPSRIVTRWAFRCIPCREGKVPSVSRNELSKLVKHGRAPHPVSLH